MWNSIKNRTLDRDSWLKHSIKTNITINVMGNDTHYLSGHQAIFFIETSGNMKEYGIASYINGMVFAILYTSILNDPINLYNFYIMSEKFHMYAFQSLET
jgi:hypothetical protein